MFSINVFVKNYPKLNCVFHVKITDGLFRTHEECVRHNLTKENKSRSLTNPQLYSWYLKRFPVASGLF